MSDAPIKTFVLRGNLQRLTKDEYLFYRFANNECRSGLWKMCILNVGHRIEVPSPISQFVQISSNFVKDHRLTDGVLESYSIALCDFLIKGRKNDASIETFDKTWFYVNCAGDELRLYFSNSLTGVRLGPMNINIFVTILIQQVR
jgi:hypothetical protein